MALALIPGVRRRRDLRTRAGPITTRAIQRPLARESAWQMLPGLQQEHVKGQKGTPFSQCVRAVNEMRRQEPQQ
jgi:hypothetical protein